MQHTSYSANLWDVRRKIAAWQKEFNEEKPHSSLGYRTPAEFARLASLGSQPGACVVRKSNKEIVK
jgi:transposase InsO family protein